MSKPQRVLSHTQVVYDGELRRVSTHDPQQAENTDSMQGGVASSWDGRGGVEDALAGGLKREHLKAAVHAASRETQWSVAGAVYERQYSVKQCLDINAICVLFLQSI